MHTQNSISTSLPTEPHVHKYGERKGTKIPPKGNILPKDTHTHTRAPSEQLKAHIWRVSGQRFISVVQPGVKSCIHLSPPIVISGSWIDETRAESSLFHSVR